jgi:serine O-acetyltransferase
MTLATKPDQPRIKNLRELSTLIREDWSVNDRSWARPGFQALAVYRFGTWRSGIRNRLVRAPFSLVYRFLHAFVRNFYGIEVYDTATFGRRLRIAHQSGIVVHPNAVIGDDCLIRQGVSIGRASNHGDGVRAKPPVIGNRVELGAGAVVVGGIVIGDDVVIGPNAVVMTDVPAGSIVVCPAARVMARPKRRGSDNQPADPTRDRRRA